jgi:HSP20 family protein
MQRAQVAHWQPIQDVLSLREAMSQLFEDSFVQTPTRTNGDKFIPEMDVSETEGSYFIEFSVPGMKPEDLNVTVENNVLWVSGEIRREKKAEEQNYHRIERRYGKFQRSITLPNTVKFNDISASICNGVLRLEVPKAEEVKPRQITVKVDAGN